MVRFGVLLLISAGFLLSTFAEDVIPFTSDNKVECVNKMVDWCHNMTYPKEGAGMAMLSIAFRNDDGKFYRIFCFSDSDGTNCTKNAENWFSCSSDNKLTYNGVVLQKDSTEGVDDEICNTTKKAFNDIFVQNLAYNPVNITTELNKGMEQFFEAMADLQEQLEFLRDRVLRKCFPFCDGNPLAGFFPSYDREYVTALPDESDSERKNQLERE